MLDLTCTPKWKAPGGHPGANHPLRHETRLQLGGSLCHSRTKRRRQSLLLNTGSLWRRSRNYLPAHAAQGEGEKMQRASQIAWDFWPISAIMAVLEVRLAPPTNPLNS